MIRDIIKKIRNAPKENKLFEYSFNQDIFFNSKKKNCLVTRKYKQDDIIKKIKARFSRALIYRLKEELKRANSKEYFVFLPQIFVKDNTKKGNGRTVLNMTFEELLKKDFYEECKEDNENKNEINKNMGKKRNRSKYKQKNFNKEIQKNRDIKKYRKNKKVLDYLENNREISKKINFDVIKKMTYSDLFEEYLGSHEFEESVLALLEEDDTTEKYIIDFIVKAVGYFDYFYNSKEKSTI